MKADKFVVPGSLGIWRIRQREGPPHVWLVHRVAKGSTRLFTDKKEALKWISWPKSTETGTAIREWLATFDDTEPGPKQPDDYHEQIKAEGFGPEAHAEDENPVANTKMVT